ncbi:MULTISPECIES: hypothetical protein [Corallococcus]|uniref:hypothetical protein n=1 Tax=Corallococcus TaxID=83461 RepID=UPI00117DE08C|nr:MULTISPECIES: hypothetical protein [Corallococcus]NBD08451.1 hypothetical protein [Corallococcus silvisoli]TSC34396.1 hypothetical protein FOF48_05050 [Corallococcus sp. Z5C101001]
MRNQLFACILAVSVILVGAKAEAIPNGWYTVELNNAITMYNQKNEPVWRGYFDVWGIWHETTYKPAGGSGREQGETLGDIKSSEGYVLAEIPRRVGGIVVIDPSKQDVVYEVSGGVEAGTIVKIPADKLGDAVHLLATVDDKGAALDVVFFGRAGTCSSKSFWISR